MMYDVLVRIQLEGTHTHAYLSGTARHVGTHWMTVSLKPGKEEGLV
jgi:hypothetical protein